MKQLAIETNVLGGLQLSGAMSALFSSGSVERSSWCHRPGSFPEVVHCPRFDPVLWFESLVLNMGSKLLGAPGAGVVSLERNPADVY